MFAILSCVTECFLPKIISRIMSNTVLALLHFSGLYVCDYTYSMFVWCCLGTSDDNGRSGERQQGVLNARVASYENLIFKIEVTVSLFRLSISGRCCLAGSSVHQPIFCRSSHSTHTCPHPVLHILLPRSFGLSLFLLVLISLLF